MSDSVTRVEDLPVARFSADRRYRYQLTRRVGFGDRTVAFLMLNPSTADEVVNDRTVRRCINYANAWGYGWLIVTNVSPLRATDPREMLAAGPEPEEVRRENDRAILEAASIAELVVAAYGVDGAAEGRDERAVSLLTDAGVTVMCLGLTKEGSPRHPLYLRRIGKALRVSQLSGGGAAVAADALEHL